jgi:hypothetical protein
MCWSKYESRLAEEQDERPAEEPRLEPKPKEEEPAPIAQEVREEELVSA